MSLDIDPNKDFNEATGAQPEQAPPATEVKPPEQPAPKPVTQLPARREPAKPIEADEKGVLAGTTLEEQFRLATAYCQSGLMPHGFDTPQKVLVGIQLLRELGLPVMTCIGKVMPLNGTAAIHSDLPLALVRRSGLLRSITEEFQRDDKGTVTGARCTVWRKGDEHPVSREFSVADAKVAQLWGKSSQSGKPSPWMLYPQRMLQYRARSWALKDVFTDVLFGVPILEYDHNATVVDGQLVGGEEATESMANKLNRQYLTDETEAAAQSQPAQASQG